MAAPPPPEPVAPPELVEAAVRAAARARDDGRPVLLSWSAPAPRELDPLRCLAVAAPPRAFLRSPEGASLAALGAAVRLDADGAGRFDAVRLQAEGLLSRAVRVEPAGAPGPRFLGGFAFADGHRAEAGWDGFPAALFLLPRFALVQGPAGAWVTANRLLEGREEPEALARHLSKAAAEVAAPSGPPSLARPGAPLPPFGRRLLEREEWETRVRAALAAVKRGPLQKVVLARRVPVPLTAPLGGADALSRVAAAYADCFLYLVEPRGGRHFLGATPERLVALRGREVRTAAVAGSSPRGPSPSADDALGQALLRDPKERREHALVVEHLRRALGDLGAKVESTGEPGLLRLRNVQHLHTPIQAELPEDLHALEVAATLHPTPAVGGAPAREAQEYIARTEGFPRGWYAGAVGWFDARGDGEFAVALRCALVEAEEAWLFAGAGIVAGADPGREWEETNLKLEPMLEALGCRA